MSEGTIETPFGNGCGELSVIPAVPATANLGEATAKLETEACKQEAHPLVVKLRDNMAALVSFVLANPDGGQRATGRKLAIAVAETMHKLEKEFGEFQTDFDVCNSIKIPDGFFDSLPSDVKVLTLLGMFLSVEDYAREYVR